MLLIETSNAYAVRGLLRGMVAYIREHGPWSIHLPEQGDAARLRPPGWQNGGEMASSRGSKMKPLPGPS